MAKIPLPKKKSKEKQFCSICFRPFKEFGNNAEPINSGCCCNKCNNLVIVARLNRHLTNTTLFSESDKNNIKKIALVLFFKEVCKGIRQEYEQGASHRSLEKDVKELLEIIN